MPLFWYKRKVKEKKKFEEEFEGNTRVAEREVEVIYWDCLNTDHIIRGIWFTEKTFAVLMDDGHEQATEKQVPIKNKNHGVSYEVQRVRDWHYSQIELDYEDAGRLAAGRMLPHKETAEA